MVLTADQQIRVDKIVRRSITLENQIEALTLYLSSPSVDPVFAKLRLENLKTWHMEYVRYHEELIDLEPENSRVARFETLDHSYYRVAAVVNRLQGVEPLANSTVLNASNANNITVTSRQDLPRLPQIKLPTFDGNPKGWAGFKNKLATLVHDRTDVGDGVKASQLLAHITDKALAKVNHLDPSEQDYQTAWSTLLDFFDQKRIVAVHHLNAILDLPKLSKATADGLSSLVDIARQHLHVLKRLEAKPSDELVVRIIERCLPPAVANRWQDKLEMNKLPKLEDLFIILQKTVFKLQALEENSEYSHQSRKRTGEVAPQTQSKSSRTCGRSLATTATLTASYIKSSPCLKCNGEHRFFKCSTFNALKVQERWEIVRKGKLCRNCLYDHPLPCRSEKRCKMCNKEHHTLLHAEKKSKIPSNGREAQASVPNTAQRQSSQT